MRLRFRRFAAVIVLTIAGALPQARRAEWQMYSDRAMLTDKMRERIEPLLSGKATGPRPAAADDRLFLESVRRRIWRQNIEPFETRGSFAGFWLPQLFAFYFREEMRIDRRTKIRACRQSLCRDQAGDQIDRRRETCIGLVIPRRDRAELLDFRKEILNLMPPAVHIAVVIPNLPPILFRGNHRLGAALLKLLEQLVRVERPVGYQSPEGQALDNLRRPDEIMLLTGKNHELHQVTERVHDRDDFTGQTAPGTPDPLPAGPPFFAPEAF